MNQYKAVSVVIDKLRSLVGRHMDQRYYRDSRSVTCLRCAFGSPDFPVGQFWADFAQMLDRFGINSSQFIKELIDSGAQTEDICDLYWVCGQHSQWDGMGYRIVCCLPNDVGLEKIEEVEV